MEDTQILERQWPYLLSFFPPESDLEESARNHGALLRKRQISRASDLLRLALVYGVCQMPLRQTAAWAQMAGVAEMSDVAVLKRLRNASDWLGCLLGIKLAERAAPGNPPPSSLRLRLVDATSISQPGSRGTDWRVHLGFDAARLSIDHIELTDAHGGEQFSRFALRRGEVVVADRAYGTRAGLHYALKSGADFIVRIGWHNLPLQDGRGHSFDLLSWARERPEAAVGEIAVRTRADVRRRIPALPVRLIAVRKTEAAASRARRDLFSEASRKGKEMDPRSLEAASYIFLLTSLPVERLTAPEGLTCYRFRWQIEMAFKRMKGLIHLGELPAKDPRLAKTYLYSKLLAALLLDDFTERFLSFSPWGFRLERTAALPVEDSMRAS